MMRSTERSEYAAPSASIGPTTAMQCRVSRSWRSAFDDCIGPGTRQIYAELSEIGTRCSVACGKPSHPAHRRSTPCARSIDDVPACSSGPRGPTVDRMARTAREAPEGCRSHLDHGRHPVDAYLHSASRLAGARPGVCDAGHPGLSTHD